jgi:phosphoadenosine phosphosulfate reductase
MHVTMVKKRLTSGETCPKCILAEELLKGRGRWSAIDEVVWAIEGDPASAGMQLAARFGVKHAPFFIVREARDSPGAVVYESVLRLVNERLGGAPAREAAPAAALSPGAGVAETEGDLREVARALADRPPWEILRYGLERWGTTLGIAFSGAEDVVLVHMASEMGLPFSVFCLDTGRLHPQTYRFIDEVRRTYRVEIALMAPSAPDLETFVTKKGLFSFYEDGHGECCGIRKVEPLRRALAGLAAWATGQRRDQSPATRSAIDVVERDRSFSGASGPLVKLNPLAAWTSAQVWQYIRDHRVPFNELHAQGFVSIGCEPCTRPPRPGEHERAGRWWWEDATKRECGLHLDH